MSNKGKIKAPNPGEGKHFKASEDKTEGQKIDYPVFCFRYLNQEYHIAKCNAEMQLKILDRLSHFSRMSWHDIQYSHRHGSGSEKLPYDSIRAQKPPQSLMTKDQFFIALRLSGRTPLVGFRSGYVFHIIYVDRDFTLYEH